MDKYTAFAQKAATVADLDATLSLMNWDLEVMMPPAAAPRRASQIGTVAALQHEIITESLKPLLEDLLGANGLDETQQRNVKMAWRNVEKAAKLPTEFVGRLAQATSEAQQVWEKAKHASDFKLFEPHLATIFALKREEADYYGHTGNRYDALLDTYEPGATTAQVEALFEALKPELRHLLDKLAALPQVDASAARFDASAETQASLNRELLGLMGFDLQHGRCDLSVHPFSTSMGMEDIRITTRVDPHDVTMMIYSSIHEMGHSFYEHGLPAAQYGLPGGQACSLSIHESQSRVWENNVCRGMPFVEFFFPKVAAHFPKETAGHDAKSFFRGVNRVEPGFIRIAADELTYHFHVALRFELERDLVNEKVQVKDIPEHWNAKMEQYLGLKVPDAAHGALQDVHWSLGSIGYFPTYSLGSFYAAQFYHFAQQAVPGLEDSFRKGDFAPFKQWLSANIWSKGRLYFSNELCERVTGKPLDVSYFMNYIRAKLSQVYGTEL